LSSITLVVTWWDCRAERSDVPRACWRVNLWLKT